MASKKNPSRADLAASDGKKSKPQAKKTAGKVKTEYEGSVPSNLLIAVICLCVCVLLVVIAVNPEGLVLQVIKSVVLGLFGQAGFYFAIPALVDVFAIQIFGRRHHAMSRSICVGVFVLTCGSIFHLMVQTQGIAQGFAVFKDLYTGGSYGTTGGVICGGIAVLLRLAFGNVISYLILGVVATLTLLGSMEITIPSLFRAISNRPKDDWDEEEEDYLEPAAVMVNHIANKRIEKRQRQRQQQIDARNAVQYLEETDRPLPTVKKRREEVQPSAPAAAAQQREQTKQWEQMPIPEEEAYVAAPARASGMMNTIDLDISAPLGAGKMKKPPKAEPAQPAVPVTVLPDAKEIAQLDSVVPGVQNGNGMPLFVKQTPAKAPEKAAQEPKAAPAEKSGKVTAKDTEESARQVAREIAKGQSESTENYCFPPLDLLKRPTGGASDGTDEMRENSRRLNETLASFKIDAHIINVTRGPSVTRYEVELDKGVRLSKLTGCADDIALSLGASGVRIAAVPGKISIVGIEVPNRAVTTVALREVLESQEFGKAKSKSSFAVGKDIGGSCIVGNIAKMPHMLIAGTTGSGKSVCMNSIILSLLYKAGPEDVKLIMVDPKMVELGNYNGIPHLLIPVVTDPKKAAGSLQWAVTEMLRRYKMMSDVGVRDLESYNSIVLAEEDGKKLPQVVIIIDELADLMLVAAKEVEDSICRIAQMGRAAGMHLIIATQRPSADVITGLMKANIPSRIAFSVASAMESRIILDTQGAEKLVGKGDMLYAPIGSGKPLRVQGCFVTDGEVEAVSGYVKANYHPDYNQEVLEEIERKAQQTGKPGKGAASDIEANDEELEGDEMLPAAVEVILETGQASVSMLQRRLKLGYARAARIVDEMEEKGYVGPFQGSKPREIRITKEEWARRGGNVQMGFNDAEDPIPEEVE